LDSTHRPDPEVEALRKRLSGLIDAGNRIAESLDLRTVLREITETARTGTGASQAGIMTRDRSGSVEHFVTSGLPKEWYDWFLRQPLGGTLCDLLEKDLRPVRRQRDIAGQLLSFESPQFDERTLPYLGTAIRYRGETVAVLQLAGKNGAMEFTSDDEELLSILATQAGAAIANARKHKDEKRARAELEALIEISPVAVFVFDARSGQTVSINRDARRMADRLGFPNRPLEEIVQLLTVRRADGRRAPDSDTPLPEVLAEVGSLRAEEVELSAPGGFSIRILVNATQIRTEDGAPKTVVFTLQDMTPLEEAERLRAEFLGLVSHELRAPLTSIKGCAASVLGASTNLDQAEMLQYFRIVEDQADRMRDLIGDLLDVARIETGTLSVSPEPVAVVTMVDQARNTFLSAGGRHPVRLDLPPDLPLVMAHRQRIVQVLDNLLSNAAQHAPEESSIRIAAKRQGVQIAISVSDQGKGIPTDRLPHLFRKFASGRQEWKQPVGAGLGLAICKGLVEAHGGRIWAESEAADHGARFTFTVPIVGDDEAVAATEPVPTNSRRGPRASRPGILVVDDDPKTLMYVRSALEGAGYEPLVTADVDEVPRLLARTQPQLVLLDLVLPGTDGIELMRRIPALAERPVIFLSGYGRDDTIAKALEAGAADYIVKPFSPTELVARIQVALRSQTAASEPYRAGDLKVDYEHRRVTLAGRIVLLTSTEYDLLRALSENAGRVSTYDHLLRRVWGWDDRNDTRPLRTVIKNLRRKLGDDAKKPRYIFTEPRVGYRMAEPVRG